MLNDLSKIALMSGKLNGTRTLKSILEQKDSLDDIENFLKDIINLKLEFDIDNEVIYINDNQDFDEHIENIEMSQYISIYPNDSFNRLYVTTDNKKTYIIRINKVNSLSFSKFISKEKPIKYSLNSFNFIKWCVAKKIDMRNVYDIPTYLKILTNKVNPFKKINEYVSDYTNYELKDGNDEVNSIIIGNFIYEFGKFLNEYAKKFEIDTVCKLINENSYYEAVKSRKVDNCSIVFSYLNIEQAVNSVIKDKEKEFEGKEYIISPLGRIAIKYGNKIDELIRDLYYEDISITILNELYNNNIHVTLEDDNTYKVLCKYKNMGNVFSLIIAILNDIFYTMFKQTFEADIHCEVKE